MEAKCKTTFRNPSWNIHSPERDLDVKAGPKKERVIVLRREIAQGSAAALCPS